MRYMLWRQIRLSLVVYLAYLTHACVMPYFALGDAVANLPIIILAVVTVGYKKIRALWVGCFYGIVLEIMLPTVPMLNLVFYPVCTLLLCLFFSDKSAARLQYDMSNHRRGRNRSVWLRTPLFALCASILFETVNLVYINLGGSVLTSGHFTRALASIAYTTFLCILLMWPIRKLLGFKAPASRVMGGEGKEYARY